MNNAFSNILSCFFVLLFCGITINSVAGERYTVKHINKEKGLKSNRTVRVIQDKRGYYWFGTIKGIQRFDGYEFIEYPVRLSNANFPDDFEVYKLFLTDDSTLLIGTSEGLLEFDELHNIFECIPFPEETNDYRVTDICTIDDSTYFLNSHTRKGVFVYHRNRRIVERANAANDSLMRNQNVRLVLKGPDSTYFFHILYDLYQYDIERDTFQLCDRGEIPLKTFFHYGMTDSDDVFWLLSGTGLYYREANAAMKRVTDIDNYCPLNKQVGSSIVNASDSSLYIALDWWGVVEISRKTKKVVSVIRKTKRECIELTSNQIYSLYNSPDGNLWWCNDGAYMLTRDNSESKFLESGKYPETANYAVLDILEDSHGVIWVGTDGGGLHKYSPEDNKTIPVSGMKNKHLPIAKVVTALFKDSVRNDLWIGTYGDGLYCYNEADNYLKQYKYTDDSTAGIQSNKIWDIERDRYGNILISTLCRAVSIYSKKSDTWKLLSLENGKLRGNCVTTFEKDENGDLWFGYTEEGLDIYNEQKQVMSNTVPHTKDRIFSIYPENDTLWLACMNGLILYSKHSNKFIKHPMQKYFENIRIHDVFKDSQHRYWVASENGLFYFYKNDSVPTYSYFDRNFGGNIAKCIIETQSGYLLIGGINGLLSVPVERAGNKKHPGFNIVLTGIKLFGENYIPHNENAKQLLANEVDYIKLPYNKNYLSFSFSVLDIAAIDDVRYAVYIENYSDNWQKIPAGHNSVDLTNLQPGTYEVKIKVMLKGNENVSKIRIVTVKITPPFWKTWWFVSLVICTLVVLIATWVWRIKNKNKILSKLVNERTNELSVAKQKLEDQYEKMKESKVVIEMKNEELSGILETKDRLIAVIAHDFKNPLNAISGFTSLLKNNFLELSQEKVQQYIDHIYSMSNALTDQMGTVLDWVRGQMNELDFKPIDINVESLLTDVLQLLHATALQKEISISVQTEYHHNAFIDARMISTVFRNILSNAIKFTPQGGMVFILLQESERFFEVSFVDSGVGMKTELAENLFAAFNPEVIKYGTNNERGTGLGLQICKSFIDINKGEIDIRSEEGKGTEVSVFLPKAQTIALKRRSNLTKFVAEDNDFFIEENDYTILLIDDSVELLSILEELFKGNYNVLKAIDGNAGLQMAQNMLPDLIVSDINMPGINGLELCKQIRQNKLTCHIPVIIITAEKMKDVETISYDFGATDFIVKPFDLFIFRKKINAFLKSRSNFRNTVEDSFIKDTHILPESVDDEVITRVVSIIKDNFNDSTYDIGNIAKEVGLSRTQLWRKMKSSLGKTPSELIKDIRLKNAKEMLKTGKFRISEIAYHVGFSDQRYFSRVFQKEFGVTPTEYMNK